MSEKTDRETTYEELSGEAGKAKVSELVKGIRIAMLTTLARDGSVSSRPMAVQDEPFDGNLWFLTRVSSEKVDELEENSRVTLTFAEPKDARFITLKGSASIRDRKSVV